MRFLIIGGSHAGISAALRAREIAPGVEVTVVLADAFPNFSICGLPFFLSGETPDWRTLAHRTEFEGIELLTNSTAQRISFEDRAVEISAQDGNKTVRYDRLLIATGAHPAMPRISGLNLEGVYPLHTMEDSFRIQEHLNLGVRSAVLVGAGYIGLEMADALVHRGMTVTLVGRSEAVLPTVDADFGRIVEKELGRRGVAVQCGTDVTAIEKAGSLLRVHGASGFSAEAEIVIVAPGVSPNTQLVANSGLGLGEKGAIRVNRRMETSQPNVYAAGDCVETWHRILERNTYLPLGTTSHKQGRVAGENAVGGDRQFEGVLGTQVVKVFDLAIGRTGLREDEAHDSGYSPITASTGNFDHKAYYPGAEKILTKVTGDRHTGRLLGARMIGHWQASVAKRLDVFATALFCRMGVDDLNDVDLSYTPPLGSPWDVVQLAAQKWMARQSSPVSVY
jgi:NADPH-dependent 2,4-dienoyl-CoA reductase/sulfur reductase-like enzyme